MPAPNDAERNWRRFVLFRVLFNSRFYYPVLAVLFLDLGLTATQYTLLNFAWALAIVLTDVPAGVLADRLGRKPLIVTATIFMVAEMTVLLFAPRNGGLTLFLFCLLNRVLSGMAEGMANGADEALVFDSLAEMNRTKEWPLVLDQVMRWQSVGMVIAMLVGGASYDPHFMTHLVNALGWHTQLDQSVTLRFPIILNLVMALLALVVVIGLREPKVKQSHSAPVTAGEPETTRTAWGLLLSAASWIVKTPVALFVVVAGLLLDNITRLFLTFSSSYFRLIHLPEAIFGLIGAALGGLGLLVAPVARRLVQTRTLAANFGLVALLICLALGGAALELPLWGVVFAVPLGLGMSALGFMVSYYLNALVDSGHRATVLSCKGVAFNLGYGFIGLLFALMLKSFQDGTHTDRALAQGFQLLPLWVALSVIVVAISFGGRRKELAAKY